ncbi:MAG: 4Fe-4S binding protein [Candidatus Bathyarchaeota archaeon]|nr:MAG: 4Fe-4S binding protein [Candidatus Bathyarchaeota archaeon]
MEIDKAKCVGCGNCHAICPMGAISLDVNGNSVVDQDKCVECSTCHRVLRDEGYPPWFVRAVRRVLSFLHLQYLAEVDVCPTGALKPPELEWPRSLRAAFSDPTVVHVGTGVGGRGTEEIKTNDVTGRLREGEAGIVVELGRPGTGTLLRDVEKVAMALSPLEPAFEPFNPVTQLMVDTATGKMNEEVLDEKVLSAIIEVKTRLERIPEYLRALEDVHGETDAVYSVGIASKCLPDRSIPHEEWVRGAGYALSPNGKTNLGLGRPLFRGASI